MLKLEKILLTGLMASGKSTVAAFLEEKGAYSFEADKAVHKLLSPNTGAGKKVIDLLGQEIVDSKLHVINRETVAEKVFENLNLLEELESILHPEILSEINVHYQRACKEGKYRFFVCEIPVLTQEVVDLGWDIVLLVETDKQVALERLIDKGSISQAYYRQKVNRQRKMLESNLPKRCALISNKGSIEELKLAVIQALKEKTSNNI
ncbi:MAG: dephospho-CoA kinase [Chlamydiales bacterium]|nr:dephospho-CoA kinase [Chlamydiales bacterium]